MEIIVGKSAGFCNGVNNAVRNTENLLNKFGKANCLGELVHNGDVIKKLKEKGLNIINGLEESNEDRVIIRAHGISRDIYNQAKILNKEIFDFTCKSVLLIHEMVEKKSKDGYFIFYIGEKGHPETIGTLSFCGNNYFLIQKNDDLECAFEKLNKSNLNKLFVIVQTTFDLNNFERIIYNIKEKTNNNIHIEVKNTICNATRIRQEETNEISKKVDCMIIVGGIKSSNTKKLYDISCKNCKNTFFVENKSKLNFEDVKKHSIIGIMAGASTPKESIEEIKNILNRE